MDYFLTEEQQMIRDLARQIAEEKIVPVRAELDEKNEYPFFLTKNKVMEFLPGIFFFSFKRHLDII